MLSTLMAGTPAFSPQSLVPMAPASSPPDHAAQALGGPGAAAPADTLALSGSAQSVLAAGPAAVADSMADFIGAAIKQLETDLTNLFRMLGLSRDLAERMARSISGALTDGLAAFQDAASRLAAGAAGVADAGGQTAFAFSLSLTVVTRTVEIRIDRTTGTISVSFAESSMSLSVESAVAQSDPLIVDVGGDGIALSGLSAGKDFDLDGDGRPERASWITGNDALLAYDRNGNGTIDDGRELFGDQHGAADGFAELGRFDGNADRRIDARDPVFGSLLLLDARGGTRGLADAGITTILLDAVTRVDLPLFGGRMVATGSFERADGGQGTVGEALFDIRA